MRTALADKLAAAGAQIGATLGSYAGAETAARFGDVNAEFAALTKEAGVYDLGWRAKIKVTGEDRVRWMNGMVTNNVRDLKPNEGNYNFVLSPQGRIQGDMYIYQRGDALLIDTEQSQREALLKLSPIGRFPVLEDTGRHQVAPESSIIIEYLDRHYPGPIRFLPEDPDEVLRVRFAERFFDFYVQDSMSKIVTDKLRPEGSRDVFGVGKARTELALAYDAIEARLPQGMWPSDEAFTLADCAALPALFYAGKVQPFADTHPGLAAYFDRIARRPSFKRVLEEAEPYFKLFPG